MATLSPVAICSLVEMHTWIDIPTAETANDDLLKELINSATEFVEQYLRRHVVRRALPEVDIFSGDGNSTYYVTHPPVASITSLAIENETTIVGTDTTQIRFDPDTGKVWLLTRGFSHAYPRNCTLTYLGAWAVGAVQADIWQACRELVAEAYYLRDKQKAGLQSVSSTISGESVSFWIGVMRPETAAKLEPYRIWRF